MSLPVGMFIVMVVVVVLVTIQQFRRRNRRILDDVRRRSEHLRHLAATEYAAQRDRRGDGLPRNGGR